MGAVVQQEVALPTFEPTRQTWELESSWRQVVADLGITMGAGHREEMGVRRTDSEDPAQMARVRRRPRQEKEETGTRVQRGTSLKCLAVRLVKEGMPAQHQGVRAEEVEGSTVVVPVGTRKGQVVVARAGSTLRQRMLLGREVKMPGMDTSKSPR